MTLGSTQPLTEMSKGKGKNKAVPLQARSGPEDSRMPKFRDNGTGWW